MRRRYRAVAFTGAAVAFTVLALLVIGRQGSGVAEHSSYADLRDVLVARVDIASGTKFANARANRQLEIRQVPASFVPPGSLGSPSETIGQTAIVQLLAGGYVTSAMVGSAERADAAEDFGSARSDFPRPGWGVEPGPGMRAVEVSVHAGTWLLASPPRVVDVFVTSTGVGRSGGVQTSRLAAGVRLLEIVPAGEEMISDDDEVGGGGGSALLLPNVDGQVRATMAVDEQTALRLIDAEVAARRITLLEPASKAR